MAEVDYQLALLLQHKYEQERKDSEIAKTLQQNFERECETITKQKQNENNLNDSLLARSLQEQFQTELEVERPGQNLVYHGSSSSNVRNNTKSLTDPSWEVIDPTPDIHNLFMAFNERFFWNQLGSVCVYWSKRMTTCAGICSYQGRGGMCNIALSEPLLKLRPRKDLVETLLHEMIHAYLFVTNNNRDRDGHGPEFHRHMNRINGEAGTTITVYHDFHDEVRLYQQHWWKCTGPCQNWKPFFGVVRRAMNRAPGPADRWWAEHSQKCNGKFIKVKEPEKAAKAQPKNQPDITKIFPPIQGSGSSTGNIKTISNNSNSTTIDKVISNSNNIVGFTDLSGISKNGNHRGGNLVKNNSSTIVVTKKTTKNTTPVSDKNSTQSLSGKVLSESTSSNPDYAAVRNHWVNKFPSTSTNSSDDSTPKSSNNNLKRGSVDLDSSVSPKIPKTEFCVECPNCFQNIVENLINSHLDKCLISPLCKNCQTNISPANFDEHIKNCTDDVFHDNDNSVTGNKQCEVCQKIVPVDQYGEHVNQCLHGMFDKIEEQLDNNKSKNDLLNKKDIKKGSSNQTECLACNKKILKSELNDHLEECMNLSHIFESDNEPTEANSNNVEQNNTYNCPVCTKLFADTDMNDHIDVCLNISNGNNV